MLNAETSIKSLSRLASSRKVLVFFTHLLILTLLFVVPEVLMSLSDPNDGLGSGMFLKSLVWIAVFYVSYYFTCDPTDGHPGSAMKYAAQCMVIILVAVFVMHVIWRYTHIEPPDLHESIMKKPRMFRHPGVAFLMRDGMVVVLTIALGLTLRLIGRLRVIDQRRNDYEAREREAELRRLKGQLNPHFLFNTLNGIYALVDIAPDRAQKAIHELSRMLRYVLYENPSTVTLGAEIEFITHYVGLMQLRLPKSIPVNANIDGGDCINNNISPMLFINIIENAFKYGSKAQEPGPIAIDISVTDGLLRCRVSNNYDHGASNGEGGIGLANLRRRLELQYEGRFTLEITAGEERFEVDMTIDISRPPEFEVEPEMKVQTKTEQLWKK